MRERSAFDMTKITIFSGFLGAGKTTLIKKLITEAFQDEQVVLIENEFGEIDVDSLFYQETGVQITSMSSGCICCSLVGDFSKALVQVLNDYHPDRILIEPSGVGKLSDVIRAVQSIDADDIELDGFATVVDVTKCKMYQKNFGEFFNNQITYASCLILSHTTGVSQAKMDECVKILRTCNAKAPIVTTEWDQLTGAQIMEDIQQHNTLDDELQALLEEAKEHDHEHHHDEDEDEDEEHEHEHHHHHHDGHDADEVFTSWGIEFTRSYTEEELSASLHALEDADKYGFIIRAKGAAPSKDGGWLYFNYVPGEPGIYRGDPCTTGRLCVIGSNIHEDALSELFQAE